MELSTNNRVKTTYLFACTNKRQSLVKNVGMAYLLVTIISGNLQRTTTSWTFSQQTYIEVFCSIQSISSTRINQPVSNQKNYIYVAIFHAIILPKCTPYIRWHTPPCLYVLILYTSAAHPGQPYARARYKNSIDSFQF